LKSAKVREITDVAASYFEPRQPACDIA